MAESTDNNSFQVGKVPSERLPSRQMPDDGSRPTHITYNISLRHPIFNAPTEEGRKLQAWEWSQMSSVQKRQIIDERGESLTRKEEAKILDELTRAERRLTQEAAPSTTAAIKAETPQAHHRAMPPIYREASSTSIVRPPKMLTHN